MLIEIFCYQKSRVWAKFAVKYSGGVIFIMTCLLGNHHHQKAFSKKVRIPCLPEGVTAERCL